MQRLTTLRAGQARHMVVDTSIPQKNKGGDRTNQTATPTPSSVCVCMCENRGRECVCVMGPAGNVVSETGEQEKSTKLQPDDEVRRN